MADGEDKTNQNAKTPASQLASSSSRFFKPKPSVQSGLPTLLGMPDDLEHLISSYLPNKDIISLARTNQQMYQTLYPTIKAAMVKALKNLVMEDDIIRVKALLRCNPNLLLREDKWDIKGKAYQGILTTPYQDALADPFNEEMRTTIEKLFPGKLEQAALQATEFEDSRFDEIRKKHADVMKITIYAYNTLVDKHSEYIQHPDKPSKEALDDSATRVFRAQNLWSKRLRKIFYREKLNSTQTFDDIIDTPFKPYFGFNYKDTWNPTRITGCDLILLTIGEKENLEAETIIEKLKKISKDDTILIRQAEDEDQTSYYLYGYQLSLENDNSEWCLVKIDDPNVIKLIEPAELNQDPSGDEDIFKKKMLAYNNFYEKLYQFGSQHGFYLASLTSSSYPVYNISGKEEFSNYTTNLWGKRREYIEKKPHLAERNVWPRPLGQDPLTRLCRAQSPEELANHADENLRAIIKLYDKRNNDLTKHLENLKAHLPEQKEIKPGM